MRNLKSIALIAALTLSNVSYAVDATGDYDVKTASDTVTVGSTVEAVAFTVSASEFTINTASLAPDTTYTVSIPVTNSTVGRTINMALTSLTATSGSSALANYGVVTLTDKKDVAGGASTTIQFTFKTKTADIIAASQTVTFAYTVTGTGAR